MRPPFRESDPNHYCRLFPKAKWKDADRHNALTDLGAAMLDPGQPGGLIDAGYTYFGQFIDHELTQMDPLQPPFLRRTWHKMLSRLKGPRVIHSAKDLENLQTPRLDLSHLYGDGPLGPNCSRLYENQVRLKVGPPSPLSGRSFDVWVDPQTKMPGLADERSSENLIIRQMAAVFARLHNAAVDQWEKKIPHAQLFEQARRQTAWQFQYLVVGDFLRKILDERIFKEVFEEGRVLFKWRSTFSIPVEFAVAAFRFGHSMVRSNYFVSNPHEDSSLGQLLERALQPGQLEDPWEIKWGFFFSGIRDGSFRLAVGSKHIDTLMARPLHGLEERLIQLFPIAHLKLSPIDVKEFKLSVRTLLRGESMRLASGQTAAKAMGEKVLSEDDLLRPREGTPPETPHEPILKRAQLLTQTPLWFYILKESEVLYNGNRLGPVGSRIVAETISGALRYDPTSYFFNPNPPGSAEWRRRNGLLLESPPTWQIGGNTYQFFKLVDLFARARELPIS